MKTGAHEMSADAKLVADSVPASSSIASGPPASFSACLTSLRAYIDHAPRLDPASRAEFCADAHRVALGAFQAATDDEKRSHALKVWAELCVWHAEGLDGFERSEQLQQAVAKLEQATQLDSSNIAAHKLLARTLVRLAERDDQHLAAISAFERASTASPHDWRVWHDWARMLSDQASRVDSGRARELLSDAADLLLRGSDAVEAPSDRARLIDDRGLTLRALAGYSSPAAGSSHLEASQAEFQRATERDPTLEAAWQHWAELLLEQAKPANHELRHELQQRALSVLARGISAVVDPIASARLSIQRGSALLSVAQLGSAAESEAHFDDAARECKRAAELDPSNLRALQLAAEVHCVRARLSEPKRARAELQAALALSSRAIGLAEQAALPSEAYDAACHARLHCQRSAIWEAIGERSRGRTRTLAFEEAERDTERAQRICPNDLETLQATARAFCERARYVAADRASALLERANELIAAAIADAKTDPTALAELHLQRGITALAQLEAAQGSARDFALATATIAFQDACSARRTFVAAWRSWSRLCSDCARRDGLLDSALEQFQEADDVLDAAAQSVPLGEGTAELLTERACIFLAQAKRVFGAQRLGCYERAIACLEEATQLAPALAEAWQCWGRALAERGHYDGASDTLECFSGALDRYQRAADLQPLELRHRVWLELARELGAFARRDPDTASTLVNELTERLGVAMREVPSQRAEYCLARGALLRDAGRSAAAELDYARGRDAAIPIREALLCQHRLSSLVEDRGCPGRERGRALRLYERYLRSCFVRIDPELVGGYGRLLFEQAGPSDLADQQLAAAIRQRAPTAHRLELLRATLTRERAQTDLVAVALVGARVESAREAIEGAELEPAQRELDLGKLALYRNDLDLAQDHFEAALSLDRWNAPACELLGLVAFELAEYERASELLAMAHELAPREREVVPLVAATLTRLGEFTDAEIMWKRSVKGAPFDPRVMLAWADACLGRTSASSHPELLARAHEYASAAIELARKRKSRRLRASQLAQAHYTRGYAAIRLCERNADVDRWEQARRDFRAALRIDPQHHEARRALARLAADGNSRRLRLQRAASVFIAALASGIFAIAQVGFWPRVQPILQFCAGTECTAPMSLRALNLTGYATLTFGALAFIALAVALPHWLRPKPASIPLERKPVEPDATRAAAS